MASQNTFIEGLDPTPLGQVSASQLLQIIREADPAENLGLVIHQDADPDIVNNPWMARCHLRRPTISPLVIEVYDNGKWTQAAMIPADNSIVNSMIKDGEITDSKIVSMSWSKLTGPPLTIPPDGPAGGDLTGDYPNPTIKNGVVTGPKIANNAVTGSHIAPGSIGENHILNGSITAAKLAGDITFDYILPIASGNVELGANQTVIRNSDNTLWVPYSPTIAGLPVYVDAVPILQNYETNHHPPSGVTPAWVTVDLAGLWPAGPEVYSAVILRVYGTVQESSNRDWGVLQLRKNDTSPIIVAFTLAASATDGNSLVAHDAIVTMPVDNKTFRRIISGQFSNVIITGSPKGLNIYVIGYLP